MKLLVIGGSKHGQQLEHTEGQRDIVVVPVLPPLRAEAFIPQNDRYCVHGSTVTSRRDGDRHFVRAAQVAGLYGLRPGEWRVAQVFAHHQDTYCIFPDYWGRYERGQLPPLRSMSDLSIQTERYVARIVSDRLVWVFVGN